MRAELIIGVDESDEGRDAVALGKLLAQVLAATPVLASVQLFPTNVPEGALVAATLELETPEFLLAAEQRFASLRPETELIATQSAAAGLHELAELRGAAIVVVGSTHRGPISRVLPGGTGARLLSGGPCAVAVAPRGYAATEQRLARLAVAFDGSEQAGAALVAAAELAGRCHASLAVLTVVETRPGGYPPTSLSASSGGLADRIREAGSRTNEAALAQLPPTVETEGRVLEGDAAGILAEASEEFDLILVGSRGYGPLRHVLLGGTTRTLFDTASCPVLALPRGGSEELLELLAPPR